MKNKVLGNCPECGSETVVESEKTIGGYEVMVERCDGLIAISDDKPLIACMWSQDIGDYYAIHSITAESGVGIYKK